MRQIRSRGLATGRRPLRLRSAQDGASAVEFALVAGFLGLLLLGLVDFGLGFWEQMQVSNAAQAGADFVQQNPYDAGKVQDAVRNATGLAGIQVTSTTTCGCASSSGLSTGRTCGSPCPDSVTNARGYVQINTRKSYAPIFAWPGLPSSVTLRGTAYAACQNTTCS